MTWKYTCAIPVIGVDETGVGPIAGPVFAAAVALKPGRHPEARDSKALSPKQREELLAGILDACEAWSCRSTTAYQPIVDVRLELMASCVEAVRQMLPAGKRKGRMVVVDGDKKIPIGGPQTCLIGGDWKCLEVACASIISKVLRDRHMLRAHREFPKYGWDTNMGYATKAHVTALLQYGKTPYHRTGPTEAAIRSWSSRISTVDTP